jgi:hypothetical protein
MSVFARTMKNKTIGVKLLDDQSINGAEPDPNHNPFEGVEVAAAYADIAKDLITHAALTIGGVWAACKIVERICK